MLPHICEHETIVDWRCLAPTRLTESALDIVLGGNAEATMAVDTGISCLPGRIGAEVFGHVRLGPACLSSIEHGRSLEAHEVCGSDRHMGFGNRKLYPVVRADGFPEDHSIFRVLHR